AATTTTAVLAGVPAQAATAGALRREVSGARRVVGLLPRQALLPVAVAWAVTTRRGRRVVPAAVVLQHLLQWRALERPLPSYTFVGVRVLDESALSVGLWTACWRSRSITPLLPPLGGPSAVRREKDELLTGR
ncbi:MAG: hypothetical protein M3P04_04190, partial [Actinomycetota bacterium]|nr:hypothetical protein [Actinomycetota bacterium]